MCSGKGKNKYKQRPEKKMFANAPKILAIQTASFIFYTPSLYLLTTFSLALLLVLCVLFVCFLLLFFGFIGFLFCFVFCLKPYLVFLSLDFCSQYIIKFQKLNFVLYLYYHIVIISYDPFLNIFCRFFYTMQSFSYNVSWKEIAFNINSVSPILYTKWMFINAGQNWINQKSNIVDSESDKKNLWKR